MCGIAGIIYTGGDKKIDLFKIAQEMIKVSKHRGPDYTSIVGFDKGGNVINKSRGKDFPQMILAHNRLAILDLTFAGNQPMSDEREEIWIVHNGEIYNYIEIREELKNKGYEFRTNTDTEVIIKAYIEWGEKAVEKFNGMWAFCIFDKIKGVLFCSRDRLGIKPFYYYWEPGIFLFSSEIKQILTTPWVTASLNRHVLADFLLIGFENHTEESLFEKIFLLPGGHNLRITVHDLIKTSPIIFRYWTFQNENLNRKMDNKTLFQSFRELFCDSVKVRLRSDVPIGITLSGGLDSSSVTSCAGRLTRDKIWVFNVSYDIKGYSEKEYARVVSSNINIPLISITPSFKDFTNNWEDFIWYVEQPVPGLSYFSNFEMYKLISKKGIRVVLTGQGGDELLLGYPRYRAYIYLYQIKQKELLKVIREMLNAALLGSMSLRKQIAYTIYFLNRDIRLLYKIHSLSKFFNREFVSNYTPRVKNLLKISTDHPDWKSLQLSELLYFQLPHLLHYEDRVSMASSVETRLPFLDHRLIEFIQNFASSYDLYKNGYSKFLLRESMRGILPEKIRKRVDKMGFETPTGLFLKRNKKYFIDLLHRNANDPILNIKNIVKNFDNMPEKKLCSILSYLTWKETFYVSI